MANKLARTKTVQPQMRAGLPCVVIVIGTVIFVSILLFLVMKYAA